MQQVGSRGGDSVGASAPTDIPTKSAGQGPDMESPWVHQAVPEFTHLRGIVVRSSCDPRATGVPPNSSSSLIRWPYTSKVVLMLDRPSVLIGFRIRLGHICLDGWSGPTR